MKTRIIDSIRELPKTYDGVLCDVWGVYHNGIRVFQEAASVLRVIRAQGGTVVLLTNAPRPRHAVADHIARVGGSVADYDQIVTSGDAAREALTSGNWGRWCYHIGPERDLGLVAGTELHRVTLENAEFLLCTGLFDDSTETAADYLETFDRALALGLPMLCSNPDPFVDRGPLRIPCAGSLAIAYEQAGGSVTYCGKPHAPIYESALRALDQSAGRSIPRASILAVGDGITTDVTGAARMGLDCLFVTGGLAVSEIAHDGRRPARNSLEAFLARHGAAPLAAARQLR